MVSIIFIYVTWILVNTNASTFLLNKSFKYAFTSITYAFRNDLTACKQCVFLNTVTSHADAVRDAVPRDHPDERDDDRRVRLQRHLPRGRRHALLAHVRHLLHLPARHDNHHHEPACRSGRRRHQGRPRRGVIETDCYEGGW